MGHTIGSPLLWAGFGAFILAMLAVDLGVAQRNSHAVSTKEAALWSGLWIGLSLLFGAGVAHWFGPHKGMEFLAGYLIEKALSVDNIFVFLVLMGFFAVPARLQHRLLFAGVFGAIVLRVAFILAGSALMHRFHWILYVFGAFLVFTGVKLLAQKEEHPNPAQNPALRWLRRKLPVTPEYHDAHFFVREKGRRYATPLFLALVAIEATDLVFAVDSIPAVFAVSPDPFIVVTSNIFAILGLRSLYFLLAGLMDKFRYLKVGLGLVLAFVGLKMLLSGHYPIPIAASLLIIAALLCGAVAASLLWPDVKASGPDAP